MAKVPLHSSWMEFADYDAETGTLSLGLKHGRVLRYAGVPSTVYEELVTAESAGQFYGAHIRTQYQAPDPDEERQKDVPWERRLLAE